MPVTVQVPSPFVRGLIALEQLSARDAERLVGKISALPRFSPVPAVTDVMQTVIKDPGDARILTRAVTSLVMQFPDWPVERMAAVVSQSVSLDLTKARREKLARRLGYILETDAIATTGRADDVASDHEHVFRGVRILTDVRPVFGQDVAYQPEAAVIVDTLRIDHSTDGETRSFYVALDHHDLEKLKQVVDRALAKTDSLRQFLASAGLAYYELEPQEEPFDATT
jgi:hypothetical protein